MSLACNGDGQILPNDLIAEVNKKQVKLVAGTNITIDETDPTAPVINSAGGTGGGDSILVDGTNTMKDTYIADMDNPDGVVTAKTLSATAITPLVETFASSDYGDNKFYLGAINNKYAISVDSSRKIDLYDKDGIFAKRVFDTKGAFGTLELDNKTQETLIGSPDYLAIVDEEFNEVLEISRGGRTSNSNPSLREDVLTDSYVISSYSGTDEIVVCDRFDGSEIRVIAEALNDASIAATDNRIVIGYKDGDSTTEVILMDIYGSNRQVVSSNVVGGTQRFGFKVWIDELYDRFFVASHSHNMQVFRLSDGTYLEDIAIPHIYSENTFGTAFDKTNDLLAFGDNGEGLGNGNATIYNRETLALVDEIEDPETSFARSLGVNNGVLMIGSPNTSSFYLYDLPKEEVKAFYDALFIESEIAGVDDRVTALENRASTLVAGSNISIDTTDPLFPIINNIDDSVDEKNQAVFTPDFKEGNYFAYTINQDCTIANPINHLSHQKKGTIALIQDDVGGHTVIFENLFITDGILELDTRPTFLNLFDYTVLPSSQIYLNFLCSFDGFVDTDINLVSRWMLNTNADDSFGIHNGTLENGASFVNNRLTLDGTDDYVKIGAGINDYKTQTCTMSAWVKLDSVSTHQIFVSNNLKSVGNGNVDNGGCQIRIRDNGLFSVHYNLINQEAYTDSNGNSATSYGIKALSVDAAVIDTLYHVVGVFDGNNAKLYVDGVLVSEVSTTESINYGTLDDVYSIGCETRDNGAISHPTNGSISKVEHYNDAKDQAFITALFNQGA